MKNEIQKRLNENEIQKLGITKEVIGSCDLFFLHSQNGQTKKMGFFQAGMKSYGTYKLRRSKEKWENSGRKLKTHLMFKFNEKGSYGLSQEIIDLIKKKEDENLEEVKILICENSVDEGVKRILFCWLNQFILSDIKYIDYSNGFEDPQKFVNIEDFKIIKQEPLKLNNNEINI